MINQYKIKQLIKNPQNFTKFVKERSHLELQLIQIQLKEFRSKSIEAKESSFLSKYVFIFKESDGVIKKSFNGSLTSSLFPIVFSTIKNMIISKLQEKRILNIENKSDFYQNLGKDYFKIVSMFPITFLAHTSLNFLYKLTKTNQIIEDININVEICENILEEQLLNKVDRLEKNNIIISSSFNKLNTNLYNTDVNSVSTDNLIQY